MLIVPVCDSCMARVSNAVRQIIVFETHQEATLDCCFQRLGLRAHNGLVDLELFPVADERQVTELSRVHDFSQN